jgi:hypothetical protein
MLATAKVQFSSKSALSRLTDDEWNELGDWAYYQTSRDKDPFPGRRKPLAIMKKIKEG